MEKIGAIWELLWEYQIYIAVFLALIVFLVFRIGQLGKWVRSKRNKRKETR